MANTYESKFKGAEVDEGVNIARNLAGTGGITITTSGTGIDTVKTINGSGKQDKLTVSSNVHINSLTIATTSATGLYFTNETGAGISYRILNAASGGTAPLARLMVPNDIAGKTQTIATREYVNAHSSSYNPGSGIDISGNTISLAKHIMVNDITLGNYSSGNVILLPQSGASGNVYFPKYGGTLATTSDIASAINGQKFKTVSGVSILGNGDITPTLRFEKNNSGSVVPFDRIFISENIYDTFVNNGQLIIGKPKTKTINGQSILGSGNITVGGGSAGVSSIGGKTGAITLSTGLAMSGQQLVNKVKVYTSGNYLCIDTN